MNRFFFKIFFRNLISREKYSIINIISLSVGLTIVLLISASIFKEYSFDQSFKQREQIYRINSKLLSYRTGEIFSTVANAVGPAMKEIPEIETTVRTYVMSFVIKVEDQPFKIDHFCWADDDFFRLFETRFIKGDPGKALSRPNTVVISEKTAATLFGKEDPIGKTILIDNNKSLEVCAIFVDYPENTSFATYQMFAPFDSFYPEFYREIIWSNIDFETFCLLNENADPSHVDKSMQNILDEKAGKDAFYQLFLQRFDKIHLYSKEYVNTYLNAISDIGKVKLLMLLAAIVLLIACINYMNLSTARAQKRAKEIGISKTLGAKRMVLIQRLYSETAIVTAVAFALAVLLSYLLMPVYNRLLSDNLDFGLVINPVFILIAISLYLFTTIIAASYPALHISGFPPLLAIRSAGFSSGSRHSLVRKILIIGQFAVSIVLISWVIVIYTQIKYINNKDLGYNPHDVMGISLSSLPKDSDVAGLENDLKTQSSVIITAGTRGFPFSMGSGNTVNKDFEDKQGTALHRSPVTPSLIDLLQIRVIAGRVFNEANRGDTIVEVVVNRKMAEFLDKSPEDLIGERVIFHGRLSPFRISGVVEDFNFDNLYYPIGAYMFQSGSISWMSELLLRVRPENMQEQLKTYEQIFKKHFPGELFEVTFPDVRLKQAYKSEEQINSISILFSILAILVACLGILGLTAYMVEQKTKEISIRKVLGASPVNIISLFTRDYVRLLVIALVIAIPISWWVGNLYLQDFAYRISVSWWMIAVAAGVTFALTLLTVFLQSLKATTVDPVRNLKTE